MRKLILLVALASSCGRTPFELIADAGVADAGVREAPIFVFTGSGCPDAGTEQDLTPLQFDGIALVKFRATEECSGAGGEWLIGTEVGSTRDLFVGQHACYFQPAALRGSSTERFAVVRYMQTAALFMTPAGWCLTRPDGGEPVSSDVKNIAWGVYATEAGAREAYERLR
ncbi:MAG: hypothetical protein Q8N23_05710 [Archangium sp.]|nr:hypothetical protein [Archangium sp.]MDP3152145.1 hypothetical protein [Archangium sp.]MDP3574973.1 hypothetical protein [Archangium sp.]